jgi:excisionase family DNA binding protein
MTIMNAVPVPNASVDVSVSRVPFAQRPTCTIAEACVASGLGRTKLYELLADGSVESTTVGRRRLVRVHSLLAFLGADAHSPAGADPKSMA